MIFVNKFLRNKVVHRWLPVAIDLVLINLAALVSLDIRFDFLPSNQNLMYHIIWIQHVLLYTLITEVIFHIFGLYKSLWRYASINEMISVILVSFWSNCITFIVYYVLKITMPRSFYIINIFVMATLVGGLRFSYRIIKRLHTDRPYRNELCHENKNKRVLILGAGEAGCLTVNEILKDLEHTCIPVGFLDDDKNKIGKKINGIDVLGSIEDVYKVVETMLIDEIILAMPSISVKRKKEILDKCKNLGVKLRILPGIYEIIDGKVNIKQIRDVQIEDLLGREPIWLDNFGIDTYIKDKVILVTGGGGSIGSELCRQISEFRPKLLIIFDIYENNSYVIQNELKRKYKNLNILVLIGSVRDTLRLEQIFQDYRPSIVFHAAAHKHVPLMQDSPFESIKNNSLGTMNIADIAGRYQCERFVLISTDKAVNPTNIMGASKRIAEIVIQSMDQKYQNTEFVAVRFGNVLGSSGSVIPLFKKQIEWGGPVTVTDSEITRYFMTIPEAVQLVLQAGSMAKGGEIFILDMGEPVKIVKLAEDLIRLSGFEPYEDIEINFIGLRPGEKLYEELLMSEEGLVSTQHEKIFVGQPLEITSSFIESNILGLKKAIRENDFVMLENHIKDLVPGYRKIV